MCGTMAGVAVGAGGARASPGRPAAVPPGAGRVAAVVVFFGGIQLIEVFIMF